MSSSTFLKKKRFATLNLKRPSKTAVELPERIEIEQVAILVQQYIELAHGVGLYDVTIDDFNFDQMMEDFGDLFEPQDFNLLYEDTDFGRGYLMGIWSRFNMVREFVEATDGDDNSSPES